MFNYELKSYEVNSLSDVLKNYLGVKKIISVNYEKLPQNGFGSVLIKMKITTTDEEENEEVVNAVAKVLPPDPDIRKTFEIEKTYMNELNFYQICLPALNEFRKEHGVNEDLSLAPKFLGGRLTSGQNGKKIDESAVIVLEDLGVLGYTHGDRNRGFGLDLTKMILSDLAKLHGTGLALKFEKPEVFKKIFKDVYEEYIFKAQTLIDFNDIVKAILMEDEDCKLLVEKKDVIWKMNRIPEVTEPFATITHNDVWMNNTMQKFVNGKIVNTKLVDYQLISYRSLAHDVFFFLWTSVEFELLKHKFDDLLKFYHEKLIETLKELHCDISPFNYEAFLKSIEQAAEYEMGHTIMFVFLVKHTKIFEGRSVGYIPKDDEVMAKIPQDVKEFIWFVVKECAKRNWKI